MYHAESDTPARVRTMNLNEDLGQVRSTGRLPLCGNAVEVVDVLAALFAAM